MEYHKIETLFERDEKTHKVTGVIRNPVYSIITEWKWTEKIDGMNIRLIWNENKLKIGGRTDNASIPSDLIQYLFENTNQEYLKESFDNVPLVIYGEGYGAGIQKGGIYSQKKQFIVFDVLIDNKWWLNWENTVDVATKAGFKSVPFIGKWPLSQAIEYVKTGFKSHLEGATGDAEGLVGRTTEALFDKKGSRLIVKLKTKDFAR